MPATVVKIEFLADLDDEPNKATVTFDGYEHLAVACLDKGPNDFIFTAARGDPLRVGPFQRDAWNSAYVAPRRVAACRGIGSRKLPRPFRSALRG